MVTTDQLLHYKTKCSILTCPVLTCTPKQTLHRKLVKLVFTVCFWRYCNCIDMVSKVPPSSCRYLYLCRNFKIHSEFWYVPVFVHTDDDAFSKTWSVTGLEPGMDAAQIFLKRPDWIYVISTVQTVTKTYTQKDWIWPTCSGSANTTKDIHRRHRMRRKTELGYMAWLQRLRSRACQEEDSLRHLYQQEVKMREMFCGNQTLRLLSSKPVSSLLSDGLLTFVLDLLKTFFTPRPTKMATVIEGPSNTLAWNSLDLTAIHVHSWKDLARTQTPT